MKKNRKSSPVISRNVHIVSLGCPKNFVDTEVLAGNLLVSGWGIAMDPDEADVFMINTCAFIHPAREEAREVISESVEWKKLNPQKRRILVCGCLIQWDKQETFKADFPEVDLWSGIDQIPNVGARLNSLYEKQPGEAGCFLRADVPKYIYNEMTPRLKLTLNHIAYIKIAEGCDNRCAYCSIPSIRGGLHSRAIASIKKEAADLLASNTRELILIAQDVTAFGHDRKSSGETLAGLIRELDDFEGNYWIRLLYAHPAHFSDELIDAVAGAKHTLPYIDMPLQHINDGILRRMGRKVTAAQIRVLLEKLRAKIPGLAIRTTFITGLPGEGDAEFKELEEFVKEQKFHRVGVFGYYPEPGTPAADMKDRVSAEIAGKRAGKIMDLQTKISLKRNKSLVGKTFDVIVDSVNGDYAVGRTYMDAPEIDNEVIIAVDRDIEAGKFSRIAITGADVYELEGEITEEKHL
jgi:ribosomal protein S12 methylthiotransferase